MKHRLLLLLLFMFVTSAVGWAQKSAPLSFTVKGILLDSLTQEGEPYATIRITKKSAPNKAVKMAVTGANGHFQKKLNVASGEYVITISSIGKSPIVKEFALKPMNCPGGMLVYKSEGHSYRDLPLRVGELGRVHRHEISGALHGLMRVRAFTQDDAHIFMLPEQIKSEILGVIKLIDEVYDTLGFKYNVELSTRPEDYMGSDEEWNMAERSLKEALDEGGLDYKINEGDGAFYGPKIDFHIEDSLGRSWQCGTIQLDFQLPQRFELEYIGSDGGKHRPIVIHRVIFGSIERFIGILIEHFAGKFPVWLSPIQVKVLPISDSFMEYGHEVIDKLRKYGIRCEIDNRSEKIGYKIREARNERIPYMIIVGEKEKNHENISLRSRDMGEEGSTSLEEFITRVLKEDQEKK